MLPSDTPAQRTDANPFVRVAQPRGPGRWIPGIAAVRTYQRPWLVKDLTAGLVLTAILVPVGMGYAEAAGLPAIYGLYATIFPLIAYAIFGPSRILVLGPDSSLAAIIAATIVPLAAGDSDLLVALAGMLALLTGILCILAGLARFGFITDLLSKPIRLGYLNGIALTVIVGQLPKILGFSSSGENLIRETISLVQGVMDGMTNWVTVAIGVSCLAIVLIFKRRWPRIPGVLIAVVGATVVVGALNLASAAGVSVVGPLPQGLPSFQVPLAPLSDLPALLAGAVAITLVAFADTSVLSRTFALRGGYTVDQNQEIIALGAANVAAGFFQGFSISSSSSRTPVAEQAGAKTQLTGVVGALCIALLLLFAPTLLQNLPNAALGAVVIAACLSLVDIETVVRLYHVRQAVANAPTRTRWVVVTAEPVTDIDTTAADALSALDDDLQKAGIELCFAEMKDPVKDRLKVYGLFTKLGSEHFFPTIGRAVDSYISTHQLEWEDWEETPMQEPEGHDKPGTP